jgi:CBS domain containing-hemolysin-like protein
VVEIIQTLTQLVITLGTLVLEIGALALQHALLIAWVAWWLWGVNWTKAWDVLARGGWMVVVLLTVLGALVWSAIAPGSYILFDLFQLPNFWWQLMATTLIVLLALFCGWLQGVFGWGPSEINLEPPAESHAAHAHH